MSLCKCPAEAAINDVPKGECVVEMGQLYKKIFQRLYDDSGARNTIADPTLLANWTPLTVAADSTKVVSSPLIGGEPSIAPGAKRSFGGGNTTRGGIEQSVGKEPSVLTGKYHDEDQIETMPALEQLICEAKAGNLGVALVDEHGNIRMKKIGAEYGFIPVASAFFSDMGGGEFGSPTMNDFEVMLQANWSLATEMVTPADFDVFEVFREV